MKRDCSTCIYKEGSCYPSTTIFDKDKTCKSYSPDYEGYIAELEKENAELKTDYEVLSCSVGDFGELQDKLEEEQRKNNGLSDNLTKAKEIIEKVAKMYRYSPRVEEIIEQVEQFLREQE